MLALATATKFVPLVLFPLFATYREGPEGLKGRSTEEKTVSPPTRVAPDHLPVSRQAHGMIR